MCQATNPLRRFTAKSRLSAACADASRDALDQHIFPVDHEYFINECLVRFRRTAHLTSNHVRLTAAGQSRLISRLGMSFSTTTLVYWSSQNSIQNYCG